MSEQTQDLNPDVGQASYRLLPNAPRVILANAQISPACVSHDCPASKAVRIHCVALPHRRSPGNEAVSAGGLLFTQKRHSTQREQCCPRASILLVMANVMAKRVSIAPRPEAKLGNKANSLLPAALR